MNSQRLCIHSRHTSKGQADIYNTMIRLNYLSASFLVLIFSSFSTASNVDNCDDEEKVEHGQAVLAGTRHPIQRRIVHPPPPTPIHHQAFKRTLKSKSRQRQSNFRGQRYTDSVEEKCEDSFYLVHARKEFIDDKLEEIPGIINTESVDLKHDSYEDTRMDDVKIDELTRRRIRQDPWLNLYDLNLLKGLPPMKSIIDSQILSESKRFNRDSKIIKSSLAHSDSKGLSQQDFLKKTFSIDNIEASRRKLLQYTNDEKKLPAISDSTHTNTTVHPLHSQPPCYPFRQVFKSFKRWNSRRRIKKTLETAASNSRKKYGKTEKKFFCRIFCCFPCNQR